MRDNLMTIPEACKICGMKYDTLWNRVLRSGLEPLAKEKRAELFDKTELLEIAFMTKHRTGPRPTRKKQNAPLAIVACTRCGKTDTGNDVRGGLCLECWCHDYCIEHHL